MHCVKDNIEEFLDKGLKRLCKILQVKEEVESMPLYRYVCDNCGNEKVVMHSMNESPEVVCEVCGVPMRKAISKVGVIFKGSGFYITDSRKSSSNGSSSEKSSKTQSKKEETKATV